MAEENVINVANRVLGLMASLVIQEEAVLVSSNTAAEEEFEDLTNTISAINAILIDSENRKVEVTERVKIWLGRIESVVYQTDDLVDEIFMVASRRRNMSKAKKVLSFFSVTSHSTNPLVFQRKMCCEMKKLNEELRNILGRDSTTIQGWSWREGALIHMLEMKTLLLGGMLTKRRSNLC